MFQPFEVFKPLYIKKLITLKKVYVVTQSYTAGTHALKDENKTGILLTDYDDIGLANIHKAAVRADKYASVINLNNQKHAAKLQEMLADDSPYQLYWSVVKDLESVKKRVDVKYKDHIRRYIQKNTTWRIGGDETIRPQLSVVFGELFIFLKRGAQELRVRFEEIEKS